MRNKKITYKIIWYDREFFATDLKLMKVWADNKNLWYVNF